MPSRLECQRTHCYEKATIECLFHSDYPECQSMVFCDDHAGNEEDSPLWIATYELNPDGSRGKKL